MEEGLRFAIREGGRTVGAGARHQDHQVVRSDEREGQGTVAGPRIRIKLRAYDHQMLDVAARDIVDHVTRTGAKVVGPVPLPTERIDLHGDPLAAQVQGQP